MGRSTTRPSQGTRVQPVPPNRCACPVAQCVATPHERDRRGIQKPIPSLLFPSPNAVCHAYHGVASTDNQLHALCVLPATRSFGARSAYCAIVRLQAMPGGGPTLAMLNVNLFLPPGVRWVELVRDWFMPMLAADRAKQTPMYANRSHAPVPPRYLPMRFQPLTDECDPGFATPYRLQGRRGAVVVFCTCGWVV